MTYSIYISKRHQTYTVLQGKLYQSFKKQIILILCKISHNIENGGLILNSFYEVSIILKPREKGLAR